MSLADMEEKIVSLSQVEAQQERIVNDMIHCMVDMNADGLEAILDNYIGSKGIDKAIQQIVFPFLERIGILWLTNHINPCQEHLVSNIIRQKLIVGIDRLPNTPQAKNTVLLFLPEGEHHELGLLYVHYLLKTSAVKLIYLGANVPIKDMEFVVKLKSPTYIFTHLTSVANNFNFEKFLQNMFLRSPSLKLVVSGQVTQGYKKNLPPNTILKKSLAEVVEFISTID
jgi:methanogenic corrinoid protein MtbC1